MSTFIYDQPQISETLMRLPFGRPGGVSASDAFTKPGNCVKTRERRKDNMPAHFGRLVSYSPDRVVVLDPPGRSPWENNGDGMLWVGTASEYDQVWEID